MPRRCGVDAAVAAGHRRRIAPQGARACDRRDCTLSTYGASRKERRYLMRFPLRVELREGRREARVGRIQRGLQPDGDGTHTHAHARTHAGAHIHAHTHTHTITHTRSHTHTHTHARALRQTRTHTPARSRTAANTRVKGYAGGSEPDCKFCNLKTLQCPTKADGDCRRASPVRPTPAGRHSSGSNPLRVL